MKWLAIIIALMGAAWFGGRAWYGHRYPEAHLNFRLTVDVTTPEGPRTGSGVIEGLYAMAPGWGTQYGDPKFESGLRGEALAVDLGPRGTLFALLRTPDNNPLHIALLQVLDYDLIQSTRTRATILAIAKLEGHAELDVKHLPLLVRFGDMADPRTVAAVDPANLAASFGDGVALSRVSVEITTDPVTRGIEKKLPSFAVTSGFVDWYRGRSIDDPRRIGPEDFLRK
jgi:hypothetical protein